MAIEFNLLSGASIDNELRLMYEILRSGESYLGFSRNHETWGQGTLFRYKPISGQVWPNDIIGPAPTAQIYDDNHRLMNISTAGTTAVQVAKFTYDTTDSRPFHPESNTDNRLFYFGEDNNGGIASGMSNIECIFINEKWTLLRGIDPTYEFVANDDVSPTVHHKYYIMNANKDYENFLEVEYITEYEYPGLDVEVQLKYTTNGSLNVATADIAPGASDLRRRGNLNGEYVVTGIGQTFITWFETDPNAKNATFFLVDAGGALLLDDVQFEETVINSDEKAYIFSYQVMNGGSTFRKVRFKLTTKENINDRTAVFKESLPVSTHVAPVADNNPPGLQISYVRSLDIHESIFDVVGVHQLIQQDVWLALEIPGPYPTDPTDPNDPIGPAENPLFYQYYDLVQTYADTDKLSIDTVEIDEDAITSTLIVKKYVRSKDLSIASSLVFNSIMIDLELDGQHPTGDIYRQIFISWKPKYYDSSNHVFVQCTQPDYSDRITFFDTLNHTLDMGTLFYVANKMPIYRNYISGNEKFKIIL